MSKAALTSSDSMRAYRACLNCRNRKSKCNLEINQGKPPCQRCQRENKECILGESFRGGRRVRKPNRTDVKRSSSPSRTTPSCLAVHHKDITYSRAPCGTDPSLHSDILNSYRDNQHNAALSWNPPSATNITIADSPYVAQKEPFISLAPTKVHEGIASADLENPSDALKILAQVADRADNETSGRFIEGEPNGTQTALHENPALKIDNFWSYEPLNAKLLSIETLHSLFKIYEEQYHPYFPIISRQSFDTTRLCWMSKNEPHLFSAILTIASRDNETIHQVCYDHMQKLILMILAGTDAGVEAVEGLLLLSQWVSRPPQAASSSIGKGEEDRVAWMYIGTALRLAYYIGLDRTSFRSERNEDSANFHRKQLVWAACYSCDRQVSIRVGKGFWARGPGPLSSLKSSNFPTLRPISTDDDDNASIFQANLEMTQIFSNVYDILYSSKGHGWKEMLEGRYAKYLDDFRASIRIWNETWGEFKCSPRIKASLLLTYEYLRLYVNAFAYQATVARSLTFKKDSPCSIDIAQSCPLPMINAAAHDSRFIYEALDAAKSLISTFNNCVDPKTIRYMPCTYYLFIIYSAVFLFKARFTTTMTDEERQEVWTIIQRTIERLQNASTGPNHMGSRYARLLQLLWRKAPKQNQSSGCSAPVTTDSVLSEAAENESNNIARTGEPSIKPDNHDNNFNDIQNNTFTDVNIGGLNMNFCSSSGFSWLDLGATCNFATQNYDEVNGSSGSLCDIENKTTSGTPELSSWDNCVGLLGSGYIY